MPGRFLLASDIGEESEHADWKPVLLDAATGEPAVPNGALGFRYGDEGKGRWNLRLGDLDPVLTLHGKLRGAGASARGTVVTIESIVNGQWLPVGSARAKAGGTFAWRYRFVHLTRDTIFSFRAVVERAPGWPWPSERSARVKVRVDVP